MGIEVMNKRFAVVTIQFSQLIRVLNRGSMQLGGCILVCSLSVFAQAIPNGLIVQEPANNRLTELLRHPTFITLRLVNSPKDPSREQPTDTPAPYTEKDWVGFQLFITQNSSENITIWSSVSPYYQYRPELMKDGDIVAYSNEAQKSVNFANTSAASGSGGLLKLQPGREYSWHRVDLRDWYETLSPGRYQLKVCERFAWDGDWVESNPVIFAVRPRIPQPIPDDVTVRLAPAGSDPDDDENRVYQLNDTWVTVYIENKSSRRLKWNVLDPEYAYRLQLFKDDIQIPYTKEITNLIRLKEENLQQVYIESDRSIEEKTISGLQNINLSNWYGPLAPGMYRLIIRRRLEFDGPWTRDSLPMLFEVPPKRR